MRCGEPTTINTALKADLDQLDAEFCPLTRRDNPDIFRGIEIRINEDGSITLHQAAYLRELAKTYDLHLQRVPETPGSASDTRGADPAAPQTASHKQIHEYMVKQGCLQWAVICSPSCAFRVNWLARHMRNPQTYHTSEQLRCMTYMYSIATKGITFRRHSPLPDVLAKGYLYDDLVGWADATWADKADSADSKSTTGFLYESKIGPLAFHTKKQSCVTNSSGEIMANRSCAMNGVWLRNLIKDIGFNFSKPTEIMHAGQHWLYSTLQNRCSPRPLPPLPCCLSLLERTVRQSDLPLHMGDHPRNGGRRSDKVPSKNCSQEI